MTKRAQALKAVREMGDDELRDHARAQRRKLFEMRFQQATGQVENHRQLRYIRREIARALTIESENRRTPPDLGDETERTGPAASGHPPAAAPRNSRRRGPSLRRHPSARAQDEQPETPAVETEPDEEDVSLSEVEPGADVDSSEAEEGDADE
ncbi:MAG: 50S ribosomal protein L29 [Candidatus Dormibacteraeota bacterium]|nr:50S ribosomal protein L29 [Candidatus Dormibacteraeota bacterium]MBV9525999.1 50S ribosomal protein L29 [Candidatus Dormibacteraeota bacterium]